LLADCGEIFAAKASSLAVYALPSERFYNMVALAGSSIRFAISEN